MDLDPSATRRGYTQVAVALIICTTLGAALGPLLLEMTDWSLARRVLVGTGLGAWCGLLISARRLMM